MQSPTAKSPFIYASQPLINDASGSLPQLDEVTAIFLLNLLSLHDPTFDLAHYTTSKHTANTMW